MVTVVEKPTEGNNGRIGIQLKLKVFIAEMKLVLKITKIHLNEKFLDVNDSKYTFRKATYSAIN